MESIETAPRDGTEITVGWDHMPGFIALMHWRDGDWAVAVTNKAIIRPKTPPTLWKPKAP
jgi:hypothetical protein